MILSFGQRLEQSARRLLPLATTLAFVLLGVVAWPLPYLGAIAPSFGLIGIYYWAMHRPDLFTPVMAFGLGVLYGLLNNVSFGLTAFIFVAVHQLVLRQRRLFIGSTFSMMWVGFVIIVILVTAVLWLALLLLNGTWMPIIPLILQGTLTIVIFPIPVWLLIHLQRKLLAQV